MSTSGETPLTYRSAGVDIDAAEDSKHRLAKLVQSTMTAGARGAFGGFGGMFRVPEGYRAPLLVSSADGVGTKIKIAIEADRHDTIGHCLVNHCTNDILVQGAVPMFFLDYVAFGKLLPHVVEGVVAGVAAGCRENSCALIGGETAEMPGVYTPPDYDLAGFIVGIVEESQVITSANISPKVRARFCSARLRLSCAFSSPERVRHWRSGKIRLAFFFSSSSSAFSTVMPLPTACEKVALYSKAKPLLTSASRRVIHAPPALPVPRCPSSTSTRLSPSKASTSTGSPSR